MVRTAVIKLAAVEELKLIAMLAESDRGNNDGEITKMTRRIA